MAAYLVVDVDNLYRRFLSRSMSVDMQELAVGLRGGATLAAGLVSVNNLYSIAVANWDVYREETANDLEAVFIGAGYTVIDVKDSDDVPSVLRDRVFASDADSVDELILASTSRDLLPLLHEIRQVYGARIRMWGSEDVLQGTRFADEIIFQPLETLLGLQSKNVAVYIDFENIAISLNEQGYVVNLDHLIERMVSRAQSYGQVVQMRAYAPWGMRGTLPPMVDHHGREILDDAPSRLMINNIDPVFNLPGKNSADIRIARDLITDSGIPDSVEVVVVASGDRDFNDVLNTLIQRGKTVIIWGVQGSTSRQLEQNPSVTVEYIENFTNLQTHQSLMTSLLNDEDEFEAFVPTQWASVVIQHDYLTKRYGQSGISPERIILRLVDVSTVVSPDRGQELVSQAIAKGILNETRDGLVLNHSHPIVEKTSLVRDTIARRVANTLQVRNWEFVNYGFLLKGLEMEQALDRSGMNVDDQWRSHWIDFLVREHVLQRELLPHRQNPDDLVPVIKVHQDYSPLIDTGLASGMPAEDWSEVSFDDLRIEYPEIYDMCIRIVVSIEQFTSFRNFDWCPLGSLHRRLRDFDPNMLFQQSVEYLLAAGVVSVDEYANPQSNFQTKGISLISTHPITQDILLHRNGSVLAVLSLYEQNLPITKAQLKQDLPTYDIDLWISIMETENILNGLPGRVEQYSLFRTHHTVKLLAGD